MQRFIPLAANTFATLAANTPLLDSPGGTEVRKSPPENVERRVILRVVGTGEYGLSLSQGSELLFVAPQALSNVRAVTLSHTPIPEPMTLEEAFTVILDDFIARVKTALTEGS